MMDQIRWRIHAFSLLAGWSIGANAGEILYDSAKSVRLIDQDVLNVAEKVSSLNKPFEEALALVNEAQLSELSNEDVEDFFEISMTLSFYSHSPRHTHEMRRAYDEMARRKLATKRMGQRMRDHYVASRMIKEASEFTRSHPDLGLESLPEFKSSGPALQAPRLWRLSPDGKVMSEEHFQLGDAPRVVVVSSPWCSFSQAASTAIARDGQLSELMRRGSTWILGQSMIPNFKDIQKWNESFPGRPMLVVDRNAEWPWIPGWDSPGFYFMKDGRVVTEVIGWPGPEQLDRLKAGFARIGLTVPN